MDSFLPEECAADVVASLLKRAVRKHRVEASIFDRDALVQIATSVPKTAPTPEQQIADALDAAIARFMAHKCPNGASDTTDNDLQSPDPT